MESRGRMAREWKGKEWVGGLDRRKRKGNGGKEMARGEAEWRQYEKKKVSDSDTDLLRSIFLNAWSLY